MGMGTELKIDTSPRCLPMAIGSGCGAAGLSLRFLASSVPLPPVGLMIPIFDDRLIDDLSAN